MSKPVVYSDQECELNQPSPVADCFGWKGLVYEVWANCREYAQEWLATEDAQRAGRILYTWNPNANSIPFDEGALNIARWFLITEEKMEWSDRTKVHRTQYENVLAIFLAEEWFQNDMATCLATLMIRIGLFCKKKKDGFKPVIRQEATAEKTEYAILRFIHGYQHYTGTGTPTTSNGWYCAFAERREKDVKKLLIRHRKVQALAHQIHVGSQKNAIDSWLDACEQLKWDDDRPNPGSSYLPQGSYHFQRRLNNDRILYRNDRSQ